MKNKKNLIYLFIIILSAILLLLVFMPMTEDKSSKVAFNPTNNVDIENISSEYDYENRVYTLEYDLGYFTESNFPKTNDKNTLGELFDVLLSTDRNVELFGLDKTEEHDRIYIIPKATKYNITFGDVVLENKTLTINYENSNPKIPRMVGHVTEFQMNALSIDMRDMDTAIYEIKILNTINGISQSTNIDFIKPKKHENTLIRNLTWGDANQLVFGANYEEKWDVWGFDLITKEASVLAERSFDFDLNTLHTLGHYNVNIPEPYLNKRTNTIMYHANFDIYEVKTNGFNNYPLTTLNYDIQKKESLLSFYYNPKPSNDGKFVLFTKVYEPMKNELWFMEFNGTNRTRIDLPQLGYVQYYEWSPKDDQILLIMSSKESELTLGRSTMWILYPNSNREPRRIATGGYNILSANFNKNNKSIAYSLKLSEAGPDISTDIWYVNSNNTEQKRLTPNDTQKDIYPVWSPDGTKIAFISKNVDDTEYYLWVMDYNGENRHIVNNNISVAEDQPLWSLDGTKIYMPTEQYEIQEFDLYSGENRLIYSFE